MRTILFALMLGSIIFSACGDNDRSDYTSLVEGTAIQVPALTGGKIQQLLIDTGQPVTAGQVLALIDTTELSLQRQQVAAGLEELNVQVDIAGTQLAQARRNEQYLQEKQQRIAALVSHQSAPQQTLDDLTIQLRQAQTAREAAEQNFQVLAARRKQIAAQLAMLNKKIRDAMVRAPAGGIISEKYYETGEAIPPLSPLAEIMAIAAVTVKIYISEPMLPHLQVGQRVLVRVDGLDREMSGSITWISPKAEFTPKNILTPETRTSLVYAVKIDVPNPDGVLKHGMPVAVRLLPR